jgi:leader peptidase (prepilin peptidase)/N-methyltransferase
MLFAGGGRKTRVPFGPFMLVGVLIAVFAGSAVASAYTSTTFG